MKRPVNSAGNVYDKKHILNTVISLQHILQTGYVLYTLSTLVIKYTTYPGKFRELGISDCTEWQQGYYYQGYVLRWHQYLWFPNIYYFSRVLATPTSATTYSAVHSLFIIELVIKNCLKLEQSISGSEIEVDVTLWCILIFSGILIIWANRMANA